MWTLIIVTSFTSAMGTTVTLQQYPSKQICENILNQVDALAQQKIINFGIKADRYMIAKCVENK